MTLAGSIVFWSSLIIFVAAVGAVMVGLSMLMSRYTSYVRKKAIADGEWGKTSEQINADRKEKEKAELHARLVKSESTRTEREKYEIRKIGGWMYFGPVISFLIGGGTFLVLLLSGAKDVDWAWWPLAGAVIPMGLMGFASNVEQKWNAVKEAKNELGTQDKFSYKYEYLYTDNPISFFLYGLAKVICALATIGMGIFIAILLFMWLGSISIAPSTIIIILLILILLK